MDSGNLKKAERLWWKQQHMSAPKSCNHDSANALVKAHD